MFAVFGFLAGGLIAGWCLRCRRFAWTGRLSVFLIWLLLFLLGLEAGGNRMVMQSLPSLGLEALGVAVGGMRCGKLCRGLAVVDVDKETRCSGQEKHAGRVRFMEGWGRKEWRRVEGCGRQYRDRGILRSRDSVRAVWTASV